MRRQHRPLQAGVRYRFRPVKVVPLFWSKTSEVGDVHPVNLPDFQQNGCCCSPHFFADKVDHCLNRQDRAGDSWNATPPAPRSRRGTRLHYSPKFCPVRMRNWRLLIWQDQERVTCHIYSGETTSVSIARISLGDCRFRCVAGPSRAHFRRPDRSRKNQGARSERRGAHDG